MQEIGLGSLTLESFCCNFKFKSTDRASALAKQQIKPLNHHESR